MVTYSESIARRGATHALAAFAVFAAASCGTPVTVTPAPVVVAPPPTVAPVDTPKTVAAAPPVTPDAAGGRGGRGGGRGGGQFEGADMAPKPPVLPVSPSEQQKRFLLPAGYRMEPVLTEPAIQQPATIAFDANGRMFVLEMRSYMLDADAKDQLTPVSRISRWEDKNNDGVYETSSVFVDSLVFPRFVTPIGGNAILTMESNSNDVYKYTDTNNDGKADKKELFTSNFGRTANVEHMQSSLFWALDNWMYSTVNNFRVRWTPKEVLREPTGPNGAQWGASQDNEGKIWFQGGASGIPSYFQFPVQYGAYRAITNADQYERGFDDIWGMPLGMGDVQGGMAFVRMPDGSLSRATAGSGANVYRGGRLPKEMIGDYFYGEVVGRVLRRVHPTTKDGITQVSNVYQPQKSEFIRSTDPLFRPVETKSAPDGSMYIVDMYHGVIQESQWTPKGSYLRAKVEQFQLEKVVGLGRIWRLTYDGMPRDTTRPKMLSERPAQLVAHLRHENGWWRDQAQQLLVLKQDKSVVPALKVMARKDTMQFARYHAIWTLEGLDALDAGLARELMKDPNPRIRIQAIRASETNYKNGDKTLAADYKKLALDPDPDVVIQAMLTMNTRKVPDIKSVVTEAVAAKKVKGVQVVGAQILNPPLESGPGGVGNRGIAVNQRPMWDKGAAAFQETCSACHGDAGEGKMAPNNTRIAPVLAGNQHVTGHPDYAIKTLLHGLTGPVEGKNYAGQIMVSQAIQNDEWVASVVSYIRNSMTNQASFVTPAQVAAIRAEYAAKKTPWTFPELAATVPMQMPVHGSWKGTASQNSEIAYKAWVTQGWSTGVPQAAGQWFQLELPQATTLAEIQFTATGGGFGGGGGGGPGGPGGRGGAPGAAPGAGAALPPGAVPPDPATAGAAAPGGRGGFGGGAPVNRSYKVEVSMDGSSWNAVSNGPGAGSPVVIAFKPVRAKFLRITQTADATNGPPWGMNSLMLFELRPAAK